MHFRPPYSPLLFLQEYLITILNSGLSIHTLSLLMCFSTFYSNSTCTLQSSGTQKSLVFSIVPGTDTVAFLWKPQVRVKCCKVRFDDLLHPHIYKYIQKAEKILQLGNISTPG